MKQNQKNKSVKIDPVCGMEVESSKSKTMSKKNGQEYYFCSEECKDKFESNPSDYQRHGSKAA